MPSKTPISTTAISSVEGRVHVLQVREGAEVFEQRLGWHGMSLRVVESAEAAEFISGFRGNALGVLEGVVAGDRVTPTRTMRVRVEDSAASSQTHRIRMSIVRAQITEATQSRVENVARQRWEFISTNAGGQWVLVNTGN